ncbi:MAG: hypothetical protein JNL66_05410 [Alphaproteobacteria bacterium]|nr:hypothetical protein [Alphaproteobacteria bacterium]
MRSMISGAVLAVAAAVGAQAAEPSMSFHYVLLQGVQTNECMTRARTSLVGTQFRLAETGTYWQYATQGDYLALISCVPAQPTVFFISVAGPQSNQASQYARAVRDAVERPAGTAPSK